MADKPDEQVAVMYTTFNAQITIYNRCYDETAKRDVWHRACIEGVAWSGKRSVDFTVGGANAANSYTLRIPQSALSGYTEPRAWRSGAKTPEKWTLQSGDVIVMGNVQGGIQRAADITGVHENSFVVTSVTDNRHMPMLGHLKVEGK